MKLFLSLSGGEFLAKNLIYTIHNNTAADFILSTEIIYAAC